MPRKLKPIEEVIANPPQPSRDKVREAREQRIEPRPPLQPSPKEKR